MVTVEKLDQLKYLLVHLAKIYWSPPTRADILALKPPIADLGDGVVKEIAVDYTSLFCGTNPDAPFPYESIYYGGHRVLMQAPFSEVKRIYQVNGYMPDQSAGNEPADHISYELGFTAFLLEEVQSTLEQNDIKNATVFINRINDFVHKHLELWLPTFCKEVRQQATTEFFRYVASLTEQALVLCRNLNATP